MKTAIQFKNVTKQYPGMAYPVMDDISFDINEGEIVTLVGPSGCGKTTTLKIINRLNEYDSGEIYILGKEIKSIDVLELRRSIGYVIQNIGLFPHMSIKENIAIVLKLNKWPKDKIDSRVDEVLSIVGLEPNAYRKRLPKQLSGGQQQRVGVARAMSADPPVLLMDEPFGAIDPITREYLQDEFLDIQKKIKKTIVFVTHDINEAIKMADKIAILKTGKLIQYDTPEVILSKPVDDFVKDLTGKDRSIKYLKTVPVSHALDENDRDMKNSLEIMSDDLLEDALLSMLQHGKTHIAVKNRKNKIIGQTSLNLILQKVANLSNN
jgi:osmoprotectant transport system ATP-binding protein